MVKTKILVQIENIPEKWQSFFHKHGMLWNAIGVRCTSVDESDLIHYQKMDVAL